MQSNAQLKTIPIENTKEKLAALKALDKGFSVFGSSRHKYEMNRALNESEITQNEKDNDIVLSEDYKLILQELGNGGAGPGYGLEKLSLKHINPPYIGSKELLRNWEDPKQIEIEMVDTDEISGYIKLFDYGCGMEYCLIVKGEEVGSIIYFDCDERFEKIEDSNLIDIYNNWLDYNLTFLKRVEQKLHDLPLQEVIDSEWAIENYSIKEMILSIINAAPIIGGHSGNEVNIHLEKEYQIWRANL